MKDSEARSILRAHGEAPTKRGVLSDEAKLRAQHYADQEAGAADDPITLEGYAAGDYDSGTSPDDFPPDPSPDPDAGLPESVPVVEAERPPRRVKVTRPARKPLRARLAGAGKGKPKKRHPRISTASMVSTAWAALGGVVARGNAPVGRCLMFQADVAGDILDDLVKGTFADPALQWAARAEAKGRKAGALVLPVAGTAIIESAQLMPESQRQMREALGWQILVSGLMLMDEVAADRAEERLERQRLDGPRREQAEKIARLIFAMEGQDAGQPAEETDRETVNV